MSKDKQRAKPEKPSPKVEKPSLKAAADKARAAKIAKDLKALRDAKLIKSAKHAVPLKSPREIKDPPKELLDPMIGQPADQEARRLRLKNLIALGKERGFLTYGEINDHLPDDMVDAEQIESIISTFNDMGITVYDEAPDTEQILIAETPPPVVADEDAVEEAEAALASADAEFGRTTDPVRMYMREMGSVELLTREGEIEIAKRIEDGLKHMIQAIAACPTTIADILELADKVARDELRIDELVDGLVDNSGADEPIEALEGEEGLEDEETELDEEEGEGMVSPSLLKLKEDALERFDELRKLYTKQQGLIAKRASRTKYLDVQQQILLAMMGIRFTAKVIERLCDGLRKQVESVRQREREIQELCVRKGNMPRLHFIKIFPGNELNIEWAHG